MTDRGAERELRRFYEAESARRRGRPLAGRRVAARAGALAGPLARVDGVMLDLGSGPGLDSAALRAAGHAVVAVDLAVASCAAAGPPAVAASVVELPFAAGAFRALWSMSVLMHVPDDAIGAALDEVARVVVPGGVAVLGTWGGEPGPRRRVDEDLGLARTFWLRPDRVWRGLLTTRLGPIERYETWTDVGIEGWWYQRAEVRIDRPPAR